MTQDVKEQAKTVLGKAQTKKEHFENNNKKLKDFIQKIRDFLMGISPLFCYSLAQRFSCCCLSLTQHISTASCCPEEGADPESIEKVAQQVLAIQLPVNRTALEKMIMQIKDGLFNLTDIEDIVDQTSQHIDKARELLEKAGDAKYVAKLKLCHINNPQKSSMFCVLLDYSMFSILHEYLM